MNTYSRRILKKLLATGKLSSNSEIRKEANRALNNLMQVVKSCSSIEDFLNYLVELGCTVSQGKSGGSSMIEISYELGDFSIYYIDNFVEFEDAEWKGSLSINNYNRATIPGYTHEYEQQPDSYKVYKLEQALKDLIALKSSQLYLDEISDYEVQEVQVDVVPVGRGANFAYQDVDTGKFYLPENLKFIN